ncbi:MAG TPA: hypothetical protein DD729_09670 [Rhodobacteraceae bacterium]|nr:hypothetical protein [Paracoccaceae bacterium]
MIATQEFVVPRSIPMTLAIFLISFSQAMLWRAALDIGIHAPIPMFRRAPSPVMLLGVYKDGLCALQGTERWIITFRTQKIDSIWLFRLVFLNTHIIM